MYLYIRFGNTVLITKFSAVSSITTIARVIFHLAVDRYAESLVFVCKRKVENKPYRYESLTVRVPTV